jgi:hypothetical protein
VVLSILLEVVEEVEQLPLKLVRVELVVVV